MIHETDLILRLSFAASLFAAVALATLWLWWRAFGDPAARGAIRRRLVGQLARDAAPADDPDEPTLLGHAGGERSTLRQLLSRFNLTAELEGSLKQSVPDLTVERFLSVAAAFAAGLGLLMLVTRGSLLAAGIAALVGGYLPFVWLARRRLGRQRKLGEQLPEGLDFLARTLRAGHALPVGLNMMGEELPAPLCEEFGRCHDQIALGTPPEDALKGMCERVESTDFAFFVTAVLVQRQTGGDLAQVLDNITGMLRQRIQLQNGVKAKTAEGRFTGVILAGFPMAMFCLMYLMSPDNAEVLVTTFQGKCLLGGSLLLSGLGLFVIRKITNVQV